MGHNFREYDERPWRDKETLYEEYIEKDQTTQELADKWGCSQPTVGKWVTKHDLSKKQFREYNDAEKLEEMYWDNGMSPVEIASEYGVSKNTILSAMERKGVERRDRAKAHQLKMWEGPASYSTGPDGYARWKTTIDTKTHQVYVHRLLAVTEYGFEAVTEMEVHHKNGVKWDNRSENIQLLTNSEHRKLHAEETDGYIGKNLHLAE